MSKVVLNSFYEALTPGYLAERKAEAESLKTLVSNKETDNLISKFHQLAGSAGSYGLSEISEVASSIEIKLMESGFEGSEELIEQYFSLVESTELEFE